MWGLRMDTQTGTLPRVLVCDDSSMARKQLMRALPEDWAVDIVQASDGAQALEVLADQPVDLMLLDLTMPIMDGYEVLAALKARNISCQVIVVSGDVQQQAFERVLELGALAFIKKPADPKLLRATLEAHQLLSDLGAGIRQPLALPNVSFQDAFREVINVAMGRAAALLARVLNVFVRLPVPNVNELEVGELHMALIDAQADSELTAVCQGYIGNGISGEALLIFHDSQVADMARLMRWQGQDFSPMEMLLDTSSVIIGACLSAIAEQLNIRFSQGHPQILGEHEPIAELIQLNRARWKKTLAVEVSYSIEGHKIHFDLLLLFSEDSLTTLRNKVAYWME